jgi:hypothetical protein
MAVRKAKAAPAEVGRAPQVAPYLLHRVHPETGLEVVFIVGELLPDWVEVSADD